jgi:hypothetical protein
MAALSEETKSVRLDRTSFRVWARSLLHVLRTLLVVPLLSFHSARRLSVAPKLKKTVAHHNW